MVGLPSVVDPPTCLEKCKSQKSQTHAIGFTLTRDDRVVCMCAFKYPSITVADLTDNARKFFWQC